MPLAIVKFVLQEIPRKLVNILMKPLVYIKLNFCRKFESEVSHQSNEKYLIIYFTLQALINLLNTSLIPRYVKSYEF